MVGNGVGAKSGILFKTAESQETTGKVAVVAVDKTGTITQGEPKVTDIFPAEGIDREDLLVAATALEQHSEHPLAKAVMQLAEEEDIAAYAVDGFEILPGNGLKAVLDGMELAGGNLSFIESIGNVPETLKRQADTLAEEGKTCLYFAAGNQVVGMIAVADVMKKDSPKAIAQIKAMGIKVVMVTGDNEKTAKAIGKAAGVGDTSTASAAAAGTSVASARGTFAQRRKAKVAIGPVVYMNASGRLWASKSSRFSTSSESTVLITPVLRSSISPSGAFERRSRMRQRTSKSAP